MLAGDILQDEDFMKYIITGTGRCGTNFMAKLLISVGIPCGRESVFNLSMKNPGKLKADSSWMALPYLEQWPEKWAEAKVIHLVRNPWDVIRGWLFDFESVFSVWKSGKAYRATNHFLMAHTPGLKEIEHPVDRCLHYYENWNRRINDLSCEYDVIRIRAENSSSSILWAMGIDPKDKQLFNNRLENTRRKCILTRKDVDLLLRPRAGYEQFINMAKEYDYESP